MRGRSVYGYARVSSVEQTRGTSLRDQQARIAAYAERIGRKVTRFFVESESGIHEKIEKREQIRELLTLVGRGDLVLVDKIDRWSRDPEFTYRSVRELLAMGASFFAVEEGIDPSTPEGDSMMSFRILFAREEHKRIKTRLVGTRKTLRDAGYYADGAVPLGYRRKLGRGEKGHDKCELVIDEVNAALVREIFRMSARGMSTQRIADETGRWKYGIRRVLTNRTYLGEVRRSDGTWRKGHVVPIIDRALFDQVQEGLDARRKGHQRAYAGESLTDTWILRDVATCMACGARMAATYASRENANTYYRCIRRCRKDHVPVQLVELAAEPLIVARLVAIREELAREPPPPPSAPRVKASDLEALERKRSRYIEAYSDGLMTREEMNRKVAAVDAKLAAVAPEPPRTADKRFRASFLREVANLEKAWRKAKPKARRAIVQHLARSVAVDRVLPPRPVWRSVEELAAIVL